jgi:hypothetical protein
VVQIWPGLFGCKQVTVCPGHIWSTLYITSGFWSSTFSSVFIPSSPKFIPFLKQKQINKNKNKWCPFERRSGQLGVQKQEVYSAIWPVCGSLVLTQVVQTVTTGLYSEGGRFTSTSLGTIPIVRAAGRRSQTAALWLTSINLYTHTACETALQSAIIALCLLKQNVTSTGKVLCRYQQIITRHTLYCNFSVN